MRTNLIRCIKPISVTLVMVVTLFVISSHYDLSLRQNLSAFKQYKRGITSVNSQEFSRGISQLRLAYRSDTPISRMAEQRLFELTQQHYLATLEPKLVIAILEQYLDMPEIFPRLLSAARDFLTAYQDVDPIAANRAVRIILALEDNPQQQDYFRQLQEKLLQTLNAEFSNNPSVESQLASVRAF